MLIAREFTRTQVTLSSELGSPLFPSNQMGISSHQGISPDGHAQLQKEIAKSTTLEQELRTLSEYFKTTRKELGRMKCEKVEGGVGDTGGFCLWGKDKFKGAGGNDMFDGPMAKAFDDFLAGKTVYDVGCGVGRYGAYWLHGEGVPKSYPYASDFAGLGPKKIKSWTGYDGGEGVEEITDNFVTFLDLAVPAWMTPAEWVVSLEVGEHIPAQFQDTLLANLDRHNTEGIILSWAVRGQTGHFHVNNLDNNEVIAIMAKLGPGYTYDKTQSEAFRSVAYLPWFRNTVMVFRKNK